jgi:hypothetical protein
MKNTSTMKWAIYMSISLLIFIFPSTVRGNNSGAVTAEELLTPLVFCPHDVTVSCTHFNSNLSVYGHPTVTNAGAHVNITENPPHFNTNSCGIGTITRSWVIHFPFSNFHCTQRITITSHGSSFNAHHIQWPLNYTVQGCHANIHPDNLPHPYNRPRWNSTPCSMIGVSFEDHVFEFNGPDFNTPGGGCKKILRTWRIIDWCTYNTYTGAGLWTYVQVIKIEDNHPPRFVFCPSDFTVGTYDNNCNGAYVNFPRPVATDNCTQNVRIRNNSVYTYNSGSDASGFYPLGTTTVRFIADDGCQNFDTCFVRVTVRDLKKPTPICFFHISTTLMPMNGDGFVQIAPRTLDSGSFDNCTPRHLLQFQLVPDRFTCANRGENAVRLIVTDQSGNSDFCNAVIRIQDNMGVCPPDTTGGLISGLVKFFNGVDMEGVEVYTKMTANSPSSVTNHLGLYLIDRLRDGGSYEIMPDKKGSLIEGVSTSDLIRLRKHITGESRLTNPYQIIAADINRDGQITIQDYLQLRMLLLLNLQSFPGMKPWRFVDRDYEFENPLNPLAEPFTEVYTIENHTKSDMELDFVGIKIGDLDGSCMPILDDDNLNSVVANRSMTSFEIATNDALVQRGQSVNVPLKSLSEEAILGIQFTIYFDKDKLNFDGIQSEKLAGFSDANIGLSRLEDGFVTVSWDRLQVTSFKKEDLISSISFTALSSTLLSDAISIVGNPLKAEAYTEQLMELPINFRFEKSAQIIETHGLILTTAPNPFTNECVVSFTSQMSGTAAIVIQDMSGRIHYSGSINTVNGLNQFTLSGSHLPSSGVYMVTVEENGNRAVKKVIYK